MKKRAKWTEAQVQKMLDWQAANNATVSQTAQHFGITKSAYSGAKFKYGRVVKKNVNIKKPKFVDIPHGFVGTTGSNKVAVIFCEAKDLKALIGGAL